MIRYKTQRTNDYETLQYMARFIINYQKDFGKIYFPGPSPENLWMFAQSKYLLETEEQLLRPFYFYLIGGDCDDQTIFLGAALLYYGYAPIEDIIIVESGYEKGHYPHVFLSVIIQSNGPDKLLFTLDALPGLKFGQRSGKYYVYHELKDLL